MLYLHVSYFPRLALKLFRGEPAISEFDWNFTATHSSSHTFSTVIRFGPPRSFTYASPWPWVGHPVSGLCTATYLFRPVKTRFRCGFGPVALNLATVHNSLVRSTKSTRPSSINARTLGTVRLYIGLPLLVSTGFQVLFHSPSGVLFTFPSRY